MPQEADVDTFMQQRKSAAPPDVDEFMRRKAPVNDQPPSGFDLLHPPSPVSPPKSGLTGNWATQPEEGDEVPGFFGTLWEDVTSIPGAAYYAAGHPFKASFEAGQRSRASLNKAHESLKAGEYEKASDYVVNAIPFIGPMAVSIKSDIDEGNYGRAMARIAELSMGTKSGRGIVKGAARGAGKTIMNTPLAGNVLRGAWEGLKEARAETPKAAPRPTAVEPVRAPTTEPGGVTPADLDAAAVSLGAKDFASVPDGTKAAVQEMARRAKDARSKPPSPPPKPAPSVGPPTPPPDAAARPSGTNNISTPVTIPVPAPAVEAGPVKAPDAVPSAPAPSTPSVAGPIPAPVKAWNVAKEMQAKGFSTDDLLRLTPDQRAEALGEDAHAFPEIVKEMKSLESRGKMDTARGTKDAALARYFQGKGIDAAAIDKMTDADLASHIHEAGYRRPETSGKLARSYSQIRHDLKSAMDTGTPSNEPAKAVVAPKRAPVDLKAAEKKAAAKPPDKISSERKGITATVRTPGQTKAKVQYRISEAGDLKTSFDEGYNQEFQPRDTSRIGSRQRIEQRKGDLDPEAMGVSRMAGDGAPITQNGMVVTRNHGVQAVKELYQQSHAKAKEYADWVAENAGLAGMTPEDVAKMKNPVLHRELAEPWDATQVKRFSEEANASSTARMSEAEIAGQMGGRLQGATMDALDVSEEGVPDAGFVRSLIKDLPADEQAQFFDRDGKVSQAGARIVRNSIFAKAYPNPAVIERMAESVDSQVRNITTGMLKAAPETAKLQEAIARGDLHPLGISEEVSGAVEVLDRLRSENQNVGDWLNQGDLLGRDPVVHSLVSILAKESRRPNVIRDTLRNYARSVEGIGSPKQHGMFGEAQIPSKLELIEEAYERATKAADEATGKRAKQASLP